MKRRRGKSLFDQRIKKVMKRVGIGAKHDRDCHEITPIFPSDSPHRKSRSFRRPFCQKKIPCRHGLPKIPKTVDLWALRAEEVRKRFPRGEFHTPCRKCGFRGLVYQSYEHFLAGDW